MQAVRVIDRFQDLSDVDLSGVGDGDIFKWDANTGRLVKSSDLNLPSGGNLVLTATAPGNIDGFINFARQDAYVYGVTGGLGDYLHIQVGQPLGAPFDYSGIALLRDTTGLQSHSILQLWSFGGDGQFLVDFQHRAILKVSPNIADDHSGFFVLTNVNETNAPGGLCLGPPTAAFPMFKRSGVGVQIRAGDDSGFGSLEAGMVTATAVHGVNLAPALTAGNWTPGAGWENPIVGPGLIKNADSFAGIGPVVTPTFVIGNTYKVVVTVSSLPVGSLAYFVGGVLSQIITAPGTYTSYITATSAFSTSIGLNIYPWTTTSRFTVSTISVIPFTLGTGDLTMDGRLEVHSPSTFLNSLNSPSGFKFGSGASGYYRSDATACIFQDDAGIQQMVLITDVYARLRAPILRLGINGASNGIDLKTTVDGVAILTGIGGSPAASLELGSIKVAATQVLNGRKAGWTTDPTGTLVRTTFVSDSVTLPDLAARVAALIVDLRAHGLIGA